MPSAGFKCNQCGNCCFSLRDAFERMQNESKLVSKVGQKRGVRVEIFYRGLIQSSWAGSICSDIRITPDYRCLFFNI